MTAPAAPLRTRPTRGVSGLLLALVCLALTGGCAAAQEATDPQASPSAASPTESILAPSPSGSPAEAPSGSARPTATPSQPAVSTISEPEPDVEIEIDGDQVSPTGDRVQARAGEPVVLRVVSDVAGQLHIHSSPEQLVEFAAGTSRHEFTVDRPGIVDVELHEPAVTLVQLEVR